jgi:hypothetical protein
MRQGPLARPWHLAAPDPPHVGDRVRRGATWPRGDQGGAGAGAAGHVMNTGGLEGFGGEAMALEVEPRVGHPDVSS